HATAKTAMTIEYREFNPISPAPLEVNGQIIWHGRNARSCSGTNFAALTFPFRAQILLAQSGRMRNILLALGLACNGLRRRCHGRTMPGGCGPIVDPSLTNPVGSLHQRTARLGPVFYHHDDPGVEVFLRLIDFGGTATLDRNHVLNGDLHFVG